MGGWVDVDAVDADGGSISRISLPSRRQPRPQHHCWRLALPVSRRRGGGVRRRKRRKRRKRRRRRKKKKKRKRRGRKENTQHL